MTAISKLYGAIDLEALFTRQLIFVSGKGGTGKTTTAVFLANLAASMGKKTLLVHMNRLGGDEWERDLVEKQPNLSQIFITPQSSFKEYMILKLKSEKLYGVFFERFSALNILKRAAPALNELVLLGKVFYECKRKVQLWTKRRWDQVVVDMPASGHAITLLNIPKVILGIFPTGIVARQTQAINALVHDKTRTALVLATLPEYMVMQETLSFAKIAEAQLDIAMGPIFVNKYPEPPPTKRLEKNGPADSLPERINAMSRFFKSRYEAAALHTTEFEKQYRKSIYRLPFVFGGTSAPEFGSTMINLISKYYHSANLGLSHVR